MNAIKKVGISFHHLQKPTQQLSLLNLDQQKKERKLSLVLDDLNKRLGKNTVTIGILPDQYKITRTMYKKRAA